jgi:hypothetical protein
MMGDLVSSHLYQKSLKAQGLRHGRGSEDKYYFCMETLVI